MSDSSVELFLAHYGVKGMKWGVRKDRKGSGSNGTSAGKGKGQVGSVGSPEATQAAVGAAFLAIHLTNVAIQSGTVTQMATRGKRFLSRNPELFDRAEGDKFSNKNYTPEDIVNNVLPGVNPDYGKWGTNMNCRRATMAYEMRRRGYDVRATRTSSGHGGDIKSLSRAVSTDKKQAKDFMQVTKSNEVFVEGTNIAFASNKISGGSSEKIFGTLDKQPNGSRGELAVMWKSPVPGIPGGGHSIAYEVIKGKAHLFDAQTGVTYGRDHKIFNSVGQAGYTRLDDKNLNQKNLAKWVK